MMEIVQKLVADKGADLAKPLIQKLGFSSEQADTFLPLAIQALVSRFMSADKDPSSSFSLGALLGGGEQDGAATDLADEVDTAELAKEAGVSPELASKGVKELAPSVVDSLKSQGMETVMGALGGGDSPLGGLGKLAGGLFGS